MSSQAPRFRVQSPSICLLICYVGQLPNWQNIQQICPISKKVRFFFQNKNSSPTDGFLQLQTPIVAAALDFFFAPQKTTWRAAAGTLTRSSGTGNMIGVAPGTSTDWWPGSFVQSMIGSFLLNFHVVFKRIGCPVVEWLKQKVWWSKFLIQILVPLWGWFWYTNVYIYTHLGKLW